ncbi:MAG: type II toxin-antitoxin system VapC family toxin [Verrucomicrobia bacterium]|nr:type II toxin-antitoxin system VapC family toxin [Verrucomicrobiota bacterium]
MKARLYLETTVPSYLTAWPSRDLIRASHQQITREWWENRRADFQVFISQLVLDEAAAGDPVAARERLTALKELPQLDINDDVAALAEALVAALALPAKAGTDAAHIALAAVHGMHFLLTWNCAHIANAEMSATIGSVCRDHGFTAPVICTPEELMGR